MHVRTRGEGFANIAIFRAICDCAFNRHEHTLYHYSKIPSYFRYILLKTYVNNEWSIIVYNSKNEIKNFCISYFKKKI